MTTAQVISPARERHVFVVCTGESCTGAGAEGLLQDLEQNRKQTTVDLRIGASNCIGHCQLAPAVMEDGRLMGAVSRRRLNVELMRLGLK